MNLPDPPGEHPLLPWLDREPCTTRLWRDGALQEVQRHPNTGVAVLYAIAAARVENADRPVQLVWSLLGTELKLGTATYAEGDSVIYITPT